MHKKNKIKSAIFTIIYILSLAHICILFRFICPNPLQTFLWWISVALIISGLAMILLSINKEIKEKKRKYLLPCIILFSVIGGVVFTINAFLFIDDLFVSILLVLSVLLVFIAFVLLQHWVIALKDNKNENIDEQLM